MMKTYEGKTEDEVVQTACLDLGVTPDQLTYEVIEEKKGLFSKKVVIECYTQSMIQEYLENFVRKTLSNMEFTVETVTYVQDGRIYCNVNTDNNSILIGKNGIILRALSFIAKNAVQNEFKKRIEIKKVVIRKLLQWLKELQNKCKEVRLKLNLIHCQLMKEK